MRIQRIRYLPLIFYLIFALSFLTEALSGQINHLHQIDILRSLKKQDTLLQLSPKSLLSDADTNYTWEKYEDFLKKISDTSLYSVLPLNEFRKTFHNNKIIIGLRHDVDNSLSHAFNFSDVEYRNGFRSTYFILHTASYYLENAWNMGIHSENIIPVLKQMQDERHFEIGWHNDLVTLQVIYNIDPSSFLRNELTWLRLKGIKVNGTASHGSNYCHAYHYLNYYFFEDCSALAVPGYENINTVPVNGQVINLTKGKLADFGLDYEAYFLNNNLAFSDATIINGVRWHTGMLDLSKLKKGDRVIILVHPIHWHQASTTANIESFLIPGQRISSVDAAKSTVTVVMPMGSKIDSLRPAFSLTTGAQAKISGVMQSSALSVNNFTEPLTYTVYAENRKFIRQWAVKVINNKHSSTAFKSFFVPGATRMVEIDTITRRVNIDLELDERFNVTKLPVSFELSEGARAWIQDVEQPSNSATVDLSKSITCKIIAEDGISQSSWTINASVTLTSPEPSGRKESLLVFPNPSEGMIHVQFVDIKASPLRIEIFNFMGEKVYSENTDRTGTFTLDIDLTDLPPGLYFMRNPLTRKQVVIVIH